MKAEERAREFFRVYVPPDAKWFIDEVLIPGLGEFFRAAVADEREACAKIVAQPHADQVGFTPLRPTTVLAQRAAAIRARK